MVWMRNKEIRIHAFPRCIEACRDELKPKDEMDVERVKVVCKGCPFFEMKGSWIGREEREMVVSRVKSDKKMLNLRVELL